MKKDFKNFLVALIVIGILSPIFYGAYKAGEERRDNYFIQQQTAYQAWLKIFPDKKITFDEWNALRLNNALPR